MNTRFRITSSLPRKLEELSVPPADVLCHAGLPPGLFDQNQIVVTTDERFALYRGLAQASRDPAIGLKLGTEHRLERYDPIAIAAVSARSFRDALQRLARFKQLTSPEALRATDRGDESRVEFRYLLAEEIEPPSLVDTAFAWVAGIARRGTDGVVPPRWLELRGGVRNRAVYQAHFGCPVRFDARHNTMVFARTDLDRPFLTHNPDLWAIVAPQLEAELLQVLASPAIGEQVKGILKPLLAGQRPGIEDVARELHLSSRTLQRKLAGGGRRSSNWCGRPPASWPGIYLLHSALELNETAYLLGYEDAHSFFRAFHQWEGSPPGEWRARYAPARRARRVAPAGMNVARA